MYSLGIIFFEMWAPFKTLFEREKALALLKTLNEIGKEYESQMPKDAA